MINTLFSFHNKISSRVEYDRFIDLSFLLSIFYLFTRFFDSVILYRKNLGDENAFTKDLIYYLENGYYDTVIHGISIPFTLISAFFYNLVNDYSISLRLTGVIFTILPLLYIILRKGIVNKSYRFIFFHLFFLIGTTGGQFYGTNDSIFYSGLIIFIFESIRNKDRSILNILLLFMSSLIFILSRPHFMIYSFILITGFVFFKLIQKDFRFYKSYRRVIYTFIFGLIVAIILNMPRLMNRQYSISHSNKIYTSYKAEDVNWTEWHYYSQMVGNNNKFGLFAPLVNWEEVRQYKTFNSDKKLPNSYVGYLNHDISHIIKRIPVSLIEVSIISIRYVGIFLIILPFVFYKQIRAKLFDHNLLFSFIILFGILTWAIIWPHIIEQRWLYPFYFLLSIFIAGDSTIRKLDCYRLLITLNIIIIDIIIIWALWKEQIFYAL
jgi:hypothetical protein